jgi:pyruvate dehydrogenase (quinone)
MVSWEQRVMEGDKKYVASQDVPKFNYAEYARMLGFEGIRIEKEEDIIPGIEQAMASQKPVLVDVLSDPNVPPLPPHISFKQMKAFTSSIMEGDVDAWDMIKQTYKDVVENYLPHK